VPELRVWAHYQDDEALEQKRRGTPQDTDVLTTHAPPFGILDRNSASKRRGCRALRARVAGPSLRLNCFGHVHASGGIQVDGGMTYVNASMVDHAYRVVRRPWIFDL
jgi:Icc-related predicted phosphoesterase